MSDRMEFDGGYVSHHDDPQRTEIGFSSGLFNSVAYFVDAPYATARTVGLRVDDRTWDSFAQAVRRHDPVVLELTDERDQLKAKLDVLTEDRANLEREADAGWKSAHEQSARAAALRKERDDARRAFETKPAVMRLEGPGAERLACLIPDSSLVDDLNATIVSQAREIARLKGEIA